MTARRGDPDESDRPLSEQDERVDGTRASTHLEELLRHLRSTIASYVHERCRAGMSVERVSAEVRGLVREAESCERIVDPSDTLLRCTVQWAIDAFDRAPGSPRRV